MEDIPEDIQSKILSYVPRESVQNSKLVSQTWKTLLSHRKIAGGLLFCFKRLGKPKLRFGYYEEVLSTTWADSAYHRHKNRFYKKLTKIKHPLAAEKEKNNHLDLIGSCNGLVCLSMRYYESRFCVLTPCTGEYFNLPTIDNKGSIVSGFGYDPSTTNYKIVRIEYPRCADLKDKGYVQVYTLGSSGWRSIGEINHRLDFLHREGVLWKGSLHWLDVKQGKVLSFDLEGETFREYLPQTPCININTEITHFKLLGGYLSIVGVDRRIRRVNIWALKYTQHKNDDILLELGEYHWSLEFSIPFFDSPYGYTVYYEYDPFDITKTNEVLLWHTLKPQDWSTTPVFFFRYDPKTDTLKEVLRWQTYGVYRETFKGIPHVNNHVSLKDLGVDQKTTKVAAHCADH